MNKKLIHTPEGVRDLYGEEIYRKRMLLTKLAGCISLYGYEPVDTPTIEMYEIFSSEVGTTASKDLFKLFDREGNTLVLRPDMTPQIGRIASKYFSKEDMPVRLTYQGNTFINKNGYRGALKETTQVGVELIGDGSVQGDAEILSLAVHSLKAAGLRRFQITVGYAGFFTAFTKACNLSEEDCDKLFDLLCNKNYFGASELLSNLEISDDLKAVFDGVSKIYRTPDDMKNLKDYAKNYPDILEAFVRFKELDELLKAYEADSYVSYELGALSNYRYYTGIIFSGYTHESGFPIVKGGRYDNLLSYFGEGAPATGFAIEVDQLLLAMERQGLFAGTCRKKDLIIYDETNAKQAILRAEGIRQTTGACELMIVKDRQDIDEEIIRKKYAYNSIIYMLGSEK